ncbi:tRNA pseudouridine synthase D [Paxillus ammoniavirescens]|nr:tRNA pseudouridine synthase D [Paxillus ammoniavirescens]
MSTSITREREDDDEGLRSPKRTKVDNLVDEHTPDETVITALGIEPKSILPPSHVLLGVSSPPTSSDGFRQLLESDVGISEYISREVAPISGIIKQRFTDFLVYEVDLDHRVVHIKSLDMPESSPKKEKAPGSEPAEETIERGLPQLATNDQHDDAGTGHAGSSQTVQSSTQPICDEKEGESSAVDEVAWGASFDTSLAPFLSEASIAQLKNMYLEGPEPPRVTDSGWGGKVSKRSEDIEMTDQGQPEGNSEESSAGRGKNRNARGGRGGRQRGRGGRSQGGEREDHRKVLSEPISSKPTRTALHHVVRKLFKGKLESETDMSAPVGDEGSRIAIKWSRRGNGRGGTRGRGERPARGEYPPYIHFTLQKTNRDTQDALAYLSRTLHVNIKDLAVAGTKDKRGVTVQRVSLRRGNKTVENVWKAANQLGRRSALEAVTQRGDRGIRIADLNYRKAGLELGMLKGNEFVITLRNMQVDSMDTLDRAMNSMKHKGFINYYGMQRFGTAAVPTHTIGLAFLQSDWHKAVSLILQVRPGEHPDVVTAREAWLVDRDLDRALVLMPRRVVAERCILESYKKQGGETRNAMGALSTIPRNLRLMYIHAYQSYVWNAIVSERVRMHGADKAVPGDLVFEEEPSSRAAQDADEELEVNTDGPTATDEHGESARASKKSHKVPWVAPKIKTLSEEDAHKHSIFDVIMPLPGRDVAYPGGSLGERYREFLKRDGLDPDNFLRKQKEYTLNGSYRKILQLPKNMSWSVLQYTDPDVALAQADEDKLLGFDPPSTVDDGKFMALQINLTLGTAAYATMALRELTKTETSSHFQTGLTQASEDQQFRGTAASTAEDADEPEEEGNFMEE